MTLRGCVRPLVGWSVRRSLAQWDRFPHNNLKDEFFDVSKSPITILVVQYMSIDCYGILYVNKIPLKYSIRLSEATRVDIFIKIGKKWVIFQKQIFSSKRRLMTRYCYVVVGRDKESAENKKKSFLWYFGCHGV